MHHFSVKIFSKKNQF